MNNPYSEMIGLMKKHGAAYNPPGISIGDVISSSPLVVSVDDLQLTAEDMYIQDGLTVNSGDNVAVMSTSDGQTYIVLCKVMTP